MKVIDCQVNIATMSWSELMLNLVLVQLSSNLVMFHYCRPIPYNIRDAILFQRSQSHLLDVASRDTMTNFAECHASLLCPRQHIEAPEQADRECSLLCPPPDLIHAASSRIVIGREELPKVLEII